MEKWAPWHSPSMAMGVPPFINAQTKVKFLKEKMCFDLEMMGFFLPYDLGVMENYFHGVKWW
jgi:hypothetical protein